MLNDFLTIGGITEDIVFFTSDGVLVDNNKDLLRQKLLAFEYGAKINIKEFGRYFGGGASNTAVNFSKMGFKVAVLAVVGKDDRTARVLDNLKKNKVDISNITINKKESTGFSFILNNKKDRIIFTYRGVNDSLVIGPQNRKIIENSRWVYLTSLPDNYLNSLKHIFAFKNKIAWNPGLNQLSGGIKKIEYFLKKTEILVINKDEGLEIVKKDKRFKKKNDEFLNKSENLIQILKKLGPQIVILTDGINGAYFYDGNNFYHQKIIKNQNRIDTTGVGDAFGSTVVAFLDRFNGDYKKAMFLGVKNVASVVSKSGAQNGLLTSKKLLAK